MSQLGLQAGQRHASCPASEAGVLTLRFKQRRDGETTRGVIGIPVHVQVVGDLVCDVCSAVYACQDNGLRVTDLCERQLKDFESPADKPEVCPRCPTSSIPLVDVYLYDSLRDNFSRSAQRHGVTCLLCPRCGQLAWAFDHSAEESRRIQEEFDKLFPRQNRGRTLV